VTDTPILRVVLFREGPCWLAQGLEYDLGTQAGNLRDLVARFDLLLTLEGPGVRSLPPAPVYFQSLWGRKAGVLQPSETSHDPAIEWGMVA
jgi:hypothetical protein